MSARRLLTVPAWSVATFLLALGAGASEPAVPASPPPVDDTIPDWTYRYLIPTLLALAIVVVVVTTIQYFLRVVRKRYKVIE
jgi:hypothetical protein